MRPTYRPGTRTGLLLAAVTQARAGAGGCRQAHGLPAPVRGALTGDCLVAVTPGVSSRRVRGRRRHTNHQRDAGPRPGR